MMRQLQPAIGLRCRIACVKVIKVSLCFDFLLSQNLRSTFRFRPVLKVRMAEFSSLSQLPSSPSCTLGPSVSGLDSDVLCDKVFESGSSTPASRGPLLVRCGGGNVIRPGLNCAALPILLPPLLAFGSTL